MQKQVIVSGIIGVIIGVAVSGSVVMYSSSQPKPAMQAVDMSMTGMVDSLKGKTGDEFDKAFIDSMIEHHQGAIDMARLAKENAKHDEIKQMADDIMNAQSKEIDIMKQWQAEWDYNGSNSTHGRSR